MFICIPFPPLPGDTFVERRSINNLFFRFRLLPYFVSAFAQMFAQCEPTRGKNGATSCSASFFLPLGLLSVRCTSCSCTAKRGRSRRRSHWQNGDSIQRPSKAPSCTGERGVGAAGMHAGLSCSPPPIFSALAPFIIAFSPPLPPSPLLPRHLCDPSFSACVCGEGREKEEVIRARLKWSGKLQKERRKERER